MGGLLILSSLLISTLLWANLENKYILYLMIFTTVSFGLIGFFDDYKKLTKNKGMTANNKYFSVDCSRNNILHNVFFY